MNEDEIRRAVSEISDEDVERLSEKIREARVNCLSYRRAYDIAFRGQVMTPIEREHVEGGGQCAHCKRLLLVGRESEVDPLELARHKLGQKLPGEGEGMERLVRASARARALLESIWMGEVVGKVKEAMELPARLSDAMFMMVQPGPAVMAELHAETEGSEIERAFRVEQSDRGVTVVAEQEGNQLRVSATVDRKRWHEPGVDVGLLGGGGRLVEARIELTPMKELPEGVEKSRGAKYVELPEWWGKPESGEVEVYVMRTPEAVAGE